MAFGVRLLRPTKSVIQPETDPKVWVRKPSCPPRVAAGDHRADRLEGLVSFELRR